MEKQIIAILKNSLKIQYILFLTTLLLIVLSGETDLGIENFLINLQGNYLASLLLRSIGLLKVNGNFLIIFILTAGFLIFYFYVNNNKENLIEEINKEEILEKELKEAFPRMFPKVNKIPLIRIFFKWCYKEGWLSAFSLAIIILAGFILRIWNLGKLGLWSDEGTVYIAVKNILQTGLPYLETGFLYLRDIPHLYLTAFSAYIFGHTEIALRLPSAIAGTMLIIFVYLLGKEIYSKKIALFAGLIIAIHPWMIEYSRISRSYILMVFFLTASYYYLTKYVKRKRINYLVPFSVFATLASLTHQTGQIILLTFVPLFIFLPMRDKEIIQEKLIYYAKNSIPYLFIILSIILNKVLFSKGFYFFAEQRVNANNDPLTYLPFRLFNFNNLKILIKILPEYWILAAAALISGIVFIKKLSIQQKLLNGTLLIFLFAVTFSKKDVSINRGVLFLFPFIVLISGVWLGPIYSVMKNKTKVIISTAILFSIILIYLPASLKITRAEYGDPINPYYSAFEGFIFRQDNKTTYQYVNKHYKNGDIIIVYGVERYAILYSKYPINYRVWSSKTTSTLNNINLYSGIREIRNWRRIKKILKKNKRIWLITTYSIFSGTEKAARIWHINQALINQLNRKKDKIVYQSKDPSARVYLIEN